MPVLFAVGQRLDGEGEDDGMIPGEEEADQDHGEEVEEELTRQFQHAGLVS